MSITSSNITDSRLTFVGRSTKRNKFKQLLNEYRCLCGNIAYLPGYAVNNGNTKSCGCLKHDRATLHLLSLGNRGNLASAKVLTKHGMSKSRFYFVYRGMMNRCYRPEVRSYVNYGGRGITVDTRWHKFENFRDDMYASYLTHLEENTVSGRGTQIDRIDNDRGYSVENCRWATPLEQILNRRKVRIGQNARLTPNQVVNILHCKGSITGPKLAALYGVSATAIGDIWRHKTWYPLPVGEDLYR